VITFDPSQPQRLSMALHTGVLGDGFSMHAPVTPQLPMA
jgi:hypothetical protein